MSASTNQANQGQRLAVWAESLYLINLLLLPATPTRRVVSWPFVTCHAALVLLGALGLSKAMAGQSYRYPLIGPRAPQAST